jgi:hypothetical protein
LQVSGSVSGDDGVNRDFGATLIDSLFSQDLTFTPMNHELAIVQAFVLPVRQERYLEFLKSSKNRKKFINVLAHFRHLDPKFATSITGNQTNPSAIVELLVGKGAGIKCWVISENTDLEGREFNLKIAVKETVGRQMGTFISCIPGKLAYFEDEDGRYILERKF